MIHFFIKGNQPLAAAIGLLLAFAGTCILTAKLSFLLPRDGGREYAVEGKLSAGKPRGAGIIFIFVFVAAALIFAPINLEMIIYLILIVAEMLTGFMDDASEKPWGGLKKGILDLTVAAIVAVTYLNFNSNTIRLAVFERNLTIPPLLLDRKSTRLNSSHM